MDISGNTAGPVSPTSAQLGDSLEELRGDTLSTVNILYTVSSTSYYNTTHGACVMGREPYQILESELSKWAKEPHVVACSSGTAALHLALEALKLPVGAEVIVPNFAMIACARAVTMAGLTPVFVDCNERLCLDLDLVDEACTARGGMVRAVMPVHIYGRRCDMDGLHTLAKKYDLYVIEDLAEAHGVPKHPDSDAACWSFYKNKIVAGEEGGAAAFRYESWADHARQLRCLGFTTNHDFQHTPRGHNYRLANSLAKLILDSLTKVQNHLHARRVIEGWYNYECPDVWKMPAREVPWVYDLRIPNLSCTKQAEILCGLREAGIEARHAFKSLTRQEEYRYCYRYSNAAGPQETNADMASREVIYLPITPSYGGPHQAELAFRIIGRILGVYPTKVSC